MRVELQALRRRMEKRGVDGCLIMTDDFHGSEYVGGYFKSREYISGFTGSAGTLVVLKEEAGLWTDGRYFLQARQQLKDSGIVLYPMGEPGVLTVEEFLCEKMKAGQTLAFDGRCVMASYARKIRSALSRQGTDVCGDWDLPGEVWENRPALSCQKVWQLEKKYAGRTVGEKLKDIRSFMKEQKTAWFLSASLEDICWTLNVRGNDVECTPVVLSYLLVGESRVIWYVQRKAVCAQIEKDLEKDGIEIKEYGQVFSDVSRLPAGSSLLCDSGRVNEALWSCIPERVTVVDKKNPTELLKAVKNPVEVENERIAHRKDGVAVTKFIHWVKKKAAGKTVTERSAADRLERYREEQENYVGPSFAPIMAYKEHGAIVHYSAGEQSDASLSGDGFLLSDTGGHYLEGTTDITRTIALGKIGREEKELYTAVLRGHIQLADVRFLKGCTGGNLDVLARAPLWEKGYDYNHGTGHGVGYLLSVHEGPNSFRYRSSAKKGADCVLEEGMITSNEPGVYLEGRFGIRLENLMVCKKDGENDHGNFLRMEPLTMVPFDREAILPEQMTEKELSWLNRYHQKVYDALAPYLSEEEKEWLRKETAPFS